MEFWIMDYRNWTGLAIGGMMDILHNQTEQELDSITARWVLLLCFTLMENIAFQIHGQSIDQISMGWDSHYKEKIVIRLSHHHHENSYMIIVKASFYWTPCLVIPILSFLMDMWTTLCLRDLNWFWSGLLSQYTRACAYGKSKSQGHRPSSVPSCLSGLWQQNPAD